MTVIAKESARPVAAMLFITAAATGFVPHNHDQEMTAIRLWLVLYEHQSVPSVTSPNNHTIVGIPRFLTGSYVRRAIIRVQCNF